MKSNIGRTKKLSVYEERNNNLRALGFDSYKDYLNSSLWARIRKGVLAAQNHSCVKCANRATEVHHTNYSVATLAGTIVLGLVAVCRPCHEAAECNPDGTMRGLKAANESLLGDAPCPRPRHKSQTAERTPRKPKKKKSKALLLTCKACGINTAKRGHQICGACKVGNPPKIREHKQRLAPKASMPPKKDNWHDCRVCGALFRKQGWETRETCMSCTPKHLRMGT